MTIVSEALLVLFRAEIRQNRPFLRLAMREASMMPNRAKSPQTPATGQTEGVSELPESGCQNSDNPISMISDKNGLNIVKNKTQPHNKIGFAEFCEPDWHQKQP